MCWPVSVSHVHGIGKRISASSHTISGAILLTLSLLGPIHHHYCNSQDYHWVSIPPRYWMVWISIPTRYMLFPIDVRQALCRVWNQVHISCRPGFLRSRINYICDCRQLDRPYRRSRCFWNWCSRNSERNSSCKHAEQPSLSEFPSLMKWSIQILSLSVPLHDRPKFTGIIGGFSGISQVIAPFLGGEWPFIISLIKMVDAKSGFQAFSQTS